MKRGHRGRGMTPSSGRSKGFWKLESCPCPIATLAGVERQGHGSLGSGGLAVGILHSLPSGPHLIQGTHPLSGVQPRFHQGQGFGGGGSFSVGEGSYRAGSPPVSGLLQPVICGDESLRVVEAGNRPLATESENSEDILQDGDSPVCTSVDTAWRLDGFPGLEGCVLAGSDASGVSQVSQVRGLWEGLPVQSSLLWPLHSPAGFHMGHGSCFGFSSPLRHQLHRYLDDWLIQASSREQVLLALDTVLQLCLSLGIVVNWEKSQLIPTQRMVYLGVLLDSISFRASPAVNRVEKLLSIGSAFLSCEQQPVSPWLELLGVLSSMIQLVPGGRLRMRSLQFVLRHSWDKCDQSTLVRWTQEIRFDLEWWLNRDRLELGVSLDQVSPQLDSWSDASDMGWGAHLGEDTASGLWSPGELAMSINARELLAIERALVFFAPRLQNSSVAVFADNSTAIAYLRNQGGTRSQLLNSLSRPNQVLDSEWTLKTEVFQELRKRWPVSIDLFATSLNHRCCPYFSPFHDPNALGTDALLQSWNGWQAYAFPPWSLIPVVLKKLWSSFGVLLTIIAPYWPQRPWFPDLLDLVVDGPVALPLSRDLVSAPLPSSSSGGVRAVTSCLETIQRFARARGFSKHVAKQSALARRSSSRAGYQARWSIFRQWCHSNGHSVSRPSLSKIADFLFWLRRSKKLTVSAVLGYRSMLSAVFRTILPEISTSPIIQDLLRSFKVEAPCRAVRPPSWDLLKVLNYLQSPVFEPLSNASLCDLTRKTLFLVALATAKRVGELQALSRFVSFSSSAAGVSYVPEFLKTETAVRPLPRFFSIQSLGNFAAGLLDDLLLCPVRSLGAYVSRTSRFVNRPR